MIYLSNNILFITMTFSRYYIYVQTFYTINNIFEIKTQNTSLKINLILIASYTKRVLHKSHNHNQNNCLVQFREDLEFFWAKDPLRVLRTKGLKAIGSKLFVEHKVRK